MKYCKVKDYSKERHTVITYFETGKLLNEAGKHYGENIIDEYSKKLVIEVGKKYNKRTLFRMKQFYNIFSNEKVSTLSTQLSFSHYTELLPIKDDAELMYYLTISINQKLGVRTLREKIKSKEYERLDEKTKQKLITNEKLNIIDYVPNPIIIKNPNNNEDTTEKALKTLILDNIDSFLLELGSGFSYIGNEYKIKLDDRNNFIDLLLFNYEYNAFVVVELKVTELKKEYIGQIEFYMNYIDKHLKKDNQNKTIGIIICKKGNKYVIDYCSDKRIISREYILI